jgi:hypothetical protein
LQLVRHYDQLAAHTLTKGAATGEHYRVEGMQVDILLIVADPDIKPVILNRNAELSKLATEDARIISAFASGNQYELQGWQIIRRSTTAYAGEWVIHDCLAIRQRG